MAITFGKRFLIYTITLALTYPFMLRAFTPAYKNKKKYPDKTVIITGATGNLGRTAVVSLAYKKVRVIMASKNMEECRSLRREIVMLTDNKSVVCRELDLEDVHSINRFADNVIKTEPHIDALINNAAVKNVKEKEITKYGIERNYFVNFIGPYLLTIRLLDKLKESARLTRDGRIINVTGKPKTNWIVRLDDINFDIRKYDSNQAYYQSKLALSYFTILLDEYLKKTQEPIAVYGWSPVHWRFSKSFNDPTNGITLLKGLLVACTSADPYYTVGSLVRCAVDESIDISTSGKLYSYAFYHWGWGKADKDRLEAQAVWNDAYRKLINLNEVTK